MARLAIFIDGGYVEKLAKKDFSTRFGPEELGQLSSEITRKVASKPPESLGVPRTFYYDCLPYLSSPPTLEEQTRFGQKSRYFSALRDVLGFEVGLGRLAKGYDMYGNPNFRQKGTDTLLTVDFVRLSAKRQISHAVILTGDGDFLPAVEAAKQERVAVWLFTSRRSCANDLWRAADERCEIDDALVNRISSNSRSARQSLVPCPQF